MGRKGELGPLFGEIVYRFDKQRFITKSPTLEGLARNLTADAEAAGLIERGEIKTLRVKAADGGRQVEMVPLPGTITAVYLPPMPPFTVPFRPEEAQVHLALVRRILEIE